jgi:hypothetical protein
MPEHSGSGKAPPSFNFNLIKGEVLTYPRGTITPTCSYYVLGTPTALTTEIVKTWFLQKIEPLVGPDAARELQKVFEEDAKRSTRQLDSFLESALGFLKGSE